MKFLSLISILFLLFQNPAFAAITLTTINGSTTYTSLATGTTIIAGTSGIAGASCAGTGLCDTCTRCEDATVVANQCTAGQAGCCGGIKCCACNTSAVADSTVLTINFTSSTATSGIPKLKVDSKTVDSTTGTGSGSSFVFTAPWSAICNIVDDSGPANCAAMTSAFESRDLTLEVSDGTNTDTATITFKIYNQQAAISGVAGSEVAGSLVYFTTYPGDEKVYIENPEGAGAFPQSASGLIIKIRFYVSDVSLSAAYLNSGLTPADLDVDADGALDEVIDGLSNDVTYHFRAASIDEAGNIFNVMDDTILQAPSAGNCANIATSVTAGDPCLFYGTPSRVLGLLTEDFNCFVATAAYGSNMDPRLQTFRDFRFKVLLPSELGRKLNFSYYKYGPYAARFISQHEWARAASRAVLWPFWGLAKISVDHQLKLWQTFSLLFVSFALFISAVVIGIRTLFVQLRWRLDIG